MDTAQVVDITAFRAQIRRIYAQCIPTKSPLSVRHLRRFESCVGEVRDIAQLFAMDEHVKALIENEEAVAPSRTLDLPLLFKKGQLPMLQVTSDPRVTSVLKLKTARKNADEKLEQTQVIYEVLTAWIAINRDRLPLRPAYDPEALNALPPAVGGGRGELKHPEGLVVVTIATYSPENPARRIQEFELNVETPIADLMEQLDCRWKVADLSKEYALLMGDQAFFSAPSSDWSRNLQKWIRETKEMDIRVYDATAAQWTALSVKTNTRHRIFHNIYCQHDFVITSVKGVRRTARHLFSAVDLRRKCFMCESAPSKFITLQDARAGQSPAYICQECFGMLHGTTREAGLRGATVMLAVENEVVDEKYWVGQRQWTGWESSPPRSPSPAGGTE